MKKKFIIIFVMVLLITSVSVKGNFKETNNYDLKEKSEDLTWKIFLEDELEEKNLDQSKSLLNNDVKVEIVKPEKALYLSDNKIIPFFKPTVFGDITVEAEVSGGEASKVEFYVDNDLKWVDYEDPFKWKWGENAFFSHNLKAKAYSGSVSISDDVDVSCFKIGSSSELSKDEAIDILINSVIKPDTLDHVLYAFTLDDTLKQGDKTSAWLPEPVPSTVERAPYPEYRTTSENEWFFYIDDSPRALFCHPVRYVFINAKTAEIEVNNHFWWPLLDDEAIFCADEDYWNPDNWAFTNDEESPPENNLMDDHTAGLESNSINSYNGNRGGESAIIVNGNNGKQTCQSSMKTSSQQMAGFFLQWVPSVQQLNPESKNNTQSDIEDAFNDTKGKDDCVVYITGHGGHLPDGHPYISCGDDLVCEYELCMMQAKNPDTEYKYVIDSCYSGGFIESLKKQPNTRKVICSCRKDEKSWSDTDREIGNIPDPNPKDKGMEFSSGFIEDLWKITWNNPNIGMVQLLDEAYISACEKDVNALNERTHPQLWERIDDPTSPKVEITSPKDGASVSSPLNVHGHASDPGGSGVVQLGARLEWAGGFDDLPVIDIDPPSENVGFELGPIDLDNYIDLGDLITITINATDDAGNKGEDSVTVTWSEEDTTPPETEKTVGEPNEGGGYTIWPFTPIYLEATDSGGSGVDYIYYEMAWDPDGNGEWDEVFERTLYQNFVELHAEDHDIFYGLIELRWYAVDNAGNEEDMHYQEHYVME